MKLFMILAVTGILVNLMIPVTLAGPPEDVRLWFGDNNNGFVTFEVVSGRIYYGPPANSRVVVTISEDRVYVGANTHGAILFTVEGDRLYVGPTSDSDCMVSMVGNRLFSGSPTTGWPLYTIDGHRVLEDFGSEGRVALTANRDLEHYDAVLKLLLPFLVELVLE